MFKHFLITRFNLRQPDWKTTKNNVPVLTEEWHKNRFELFVKYCFYSVAAQTNKDFEWLVFFDTTTPKKYKLIIDELDKKLVNFKPFFVEGMEQFLPGIKSYVSNFNQEYIITSRIDNDDCLSKDYIDAVQKQFNQQNFTAIDFIDGYTIQTSPNIKIGKRFDQYNPFISLIEKNDDPKTVWAIRHSHWKREKNIVQIRNHRTWAAVIHQENKINAFVGYDDVNLTEFFKDFIIDPSEVTKLKNEAIPYIEWKKESKRNHISSYWNYTFKNIKKKLGVYKFK
ncbi:glycosyltransferase [uncultured Algibacter sp.]|uniref:glycosyltransferase n=1 Tax=uncultured Algibacter sp. TaxID=298659 RepID=UPI0026119C33|nr:glycosyltransferase [uncultured Algibacter sp.]